MYKLRVGVSIDYFNRSMLTVRDEFEKDLDEVKNLGFDTIDLNLCTIYNRDMILQSHPLIPQALDTIRQKGIQVNAVHLPFGGHRDYSNLDEEYRNRLIDDTTEMLAITDQYAPYCYVMHASAEPIKILEREYRMVALHNSLRKLSPATKHLLCVENLPRTCLLNSIDEHRRAVDGVSDLANVKLCCDVNHYLSDKAETAIEVLGERIKTLHISDHDYIDERHVLPKDGKIDWMALIGALEKTDYQGVFNYEITRSLNEYVFYTLADIKRNYEELFEEYNRMK